MKRADWEYIKRLSMLNKNFKHLSENNLFELKDLEEINSEFDINKRIEAYYVINELIMLDIPDVFINKTFNCLSYSKTRNDDAFFTLKFENNVCTILFLNTQYSNNDIFLEVNINYSQYYEKDSVYDSIVLSEPTQYGELNQPSLGKLKHNHEGLSRNAILILWHFIELIKYANKNQFIFFQITKKWNNKKSKVSIANDKKPWARGDLSSIVYLNKFPEPTSKNSKDNEHNKGTHASPRFHFRRGTMRKLTNERYKNHPKFGKEIYVKSCWVGEKEVIINGVTYKVL